MVSPLFAPTEKEGLARRIANRLRFFGSQRQYTSLDSPAAGLTFINGGQGVYVDVNLYFDGTSWFLIDPNQIGAIYAFGYAGQVLLYTATAGTGPRTLVGPVNLLQGPSTWVAPTLAANWSDFGAGWATSGYKLYPDGRVALRGMIKKSVAVVAGETIFTLPAGFRPAQQEYFAINSNSAFGTIWITTAGAVNLQLGNAAFVSISGITFDTV